MLSNEDGLSEGDSRLVEALLTREDPSLEKELFDELNAECIRYFRTPEHLPTVELWELADHSFLGYDQYAGEFFLWQKSKEA